MTFPPNIRDLGSTLDQYSPEVQVALMASELRSFGLLGFAHYYEEHPRGSFPYSLTGYICGKHMTLCYLDSGVMQDYDLVREVSQCSQAI